MLGGYWEILGGYWGMGGSAGATHMRLLGEIFLPSRNQVTWGWGKLAMRGARMTAASPWDTLCCASLSSKLPMSAGRRGQRHGDKAGSGPGAGWRLRGRAPTGAGRIRRGLLLPSEPPHCSHVPGAALAPGPIPADPRAAYPHLNKPDRGLHRGWGQRGGLSPGAPR